jgi:hypothetical protein
MPDTQQENNISQKVEEREPITIGSDPELGIFSPISNSFLEADAVFTPVDDSGEKVYPQSQDCDFGFDGYTATAEIRPKPATDPEEAIKNIREILERNKNKYPNVFKYNLMATSDKLSLGGHIHFGHSLLRENTPRGRELIERMILNLDNLLGFPVMFLEKDEYAFFRKVSRGYGKLGDVRLQGWGFEYRTLPSFLSCQKLARDILYLAHAIADATIYHNYRCNPVIKDSAFRYAFERQSRELLRPQLKFVFAQQRELPKVKEEERYQKAIEDFIREVKRERPLFAIEIKKGWHIKFDTNKFWRAYTFEKLVMKVVKILLEVHKKGVSKLVASGKYKLPSVKFVRANYRDFACAEIETNVNFAIFNAISREILDQVSGFINVVYVYGLKEVRGNVIWMGNSNIRGRGTVRFIDLLFEIAKGFTDQSPIENVEHKLTSAFRGLGLGLRAREENILFLEIATAIFAILNNERIYSSKIEFRGKIKKIYIKKKNVLESIFKPMKVCKKIAASLPVTKLPESLGGIQLPDPIDLNMTYYQILGLLFEQAGFTSDEKLSFVRKLEDVARQISEYTKPKREYESVKCLALPLKEVSDDELVYQFYSLCKEVAERFSNYGDDFNYMDWEKIFKEEGGEE